MVHKFLINKELKYAVLGIFGETACYQLNQIKEQEGELDELTADEIASNGEEMFRLFETVPEANAYAQGIMDMLGNNDYAFLTGEEHKALFQQISPAEYLGVVESEKKEAEEAMHDPAREEDETESQDCGEIGLLASLMTFHLIKKLNKHYNNGLIHAMDAISCLACMFEKKYRHVTEWSEFLEQDELAQSWNIDDWEEFAIEWAWQNKDNCFGKSQAELDAENKK